MGGLQILIGVTNFTSDMIPLFLLCRLLVILFLVLLTMVDRRMVHIHSIKFPSHIVFGTPSPVRSISSDLILGTLYITRLDIVNFLDIAIFWIISSSIVTSTSCWLIEGL